MYKKQHLLRLKCVLCSVFPFQMSEKKESENVASVFNQERNRGSGKDRLREMFSLDEMGSFSPEVVQVYQATIFTTLLGASYGGFISMKPTPEETQRLNELALKTKYHERHRATIGGQEVALKFIKGALHWGWRVGLFCSSIVLITSSVSVYRGHSGILEYTMAGAVIGTAMGMKSRRLKAVGIGGVLGVALGAVGGYAMYTSKTLTGTTTEKTRFWQDGWKEMQLKPTKDTARKLSEERSLLAANTQREEPSNTFTEGKSEQR